MGSIPYLARNKKQKNMELRTTKFDVTAEHIGYYLNLPVDIEIDYWTERMDEKVIAWYLEVYASKGGIPYIQSHFQYINVTIHWSIDNDDLSEEQITRLKHRHEVTESGNNLQGFIMVYTIREKDKNCVLISILTSLTAMDTLRT